MRSRWLIALPVLAFAVAPAASASVTDAGSTIDGAQGAKGDRVITHVRTIRDRADLAGFGVAGHWFAQFDPPAPIDEAPTGDNVRDALPSWVAAFNHTEHPADPGCTESDALPRGCTPTYNFRTFSQDGPARSAGGQRGWATLRLPDGECGRAGAIVDPQTYADDEPNNNNTINRIQLQDGVPDTFFVGVVTDTTGEQHDPGHVEIRGNVGIVDQNGNVADSQVDASSTPGSDALAPNGVPDIHVFRVEHFRSGDYLKLRLRGASAAASFAGLLFDEAFDPARELAAPRPVAPDCVRRDAGRAG